MDRAKLFPNGQSQAVRLPKPYRFNGAEVYVQKYGSGVLLLPVTDFWEALLQSLDAFSSDYLGTPAVPTPESAVVEADEDEVPSILWD